jgi:hypothetical protein
MSMMDDLIRVMDQVERVDPFVDARAYAVVVMSPDRHYRLMRERSPRAPMDPSWRSGALPLFGYPVKVEHDAPEEPFLQFRMTPSQLVDVIQAAQRRDAFSSMPAPASAPTLKAVVKKWWKGIKR